MSLSSRPTAAIRFGCGVVSQQLQLLKKKKINCGMQNADAEIAGRSRWAALIRPVT